VNGGTKNGNGIENVIFEDGVKGKIGGGDGPQIMWSRETVENNAEIMKIFGHWVTGRTGTKSEISGVSF